MRSFVLWIVVAVSWIFRLIPGKARGGLIFGLLMIESRIGQPAAALRRLYPIKDNLERLLSERAMSYEGGIHPKHRLMRYHDFFVENIQQGSRVVDIGCGNGAVARSIALNVPGSEVCGVEMDEYRFRQAASADNPKNLEFIFGDAFQVLPKGAADVVILSNVLEHIEDRQAFLSRIIDVLSPGEILIRVPAFQREWHVPLRKELGITYFNDRTHFVEHTVAEFEGELQRARVQIDSLKTIWGEIWAVCHPDKPTGQ
ncbi:class I SAM-dependent methyltransferase [Thalassospira sp. GB04J01]|uniref:class I SAM-dependent methyltransferase n=1 Tax=Thalassospira sp. GB04J01 TaxID=1485225 RepID=UPI000C9AED2A|nr:class I SAM-dependent methyltransferase [Thalassospira sp. GB04J01]|tara:strand:- start:3497 stop:4267 length:771 start_codon:yes stop_codon:yes gene_type:complete